VTRLTDANGTFGLAVESPEPISLTRDVALQLIQHVRVWVPGPIPLSGPFADLTFGTDRVTAGGPLTNLAPGDQIARIVAVPGGSRIDVYDPPHAGPGPLRVTLSAAQAALQPAYAAIANLPPGTIVVLQPGGISDVIGHGHWIWKDTPVPVTALTNGNETTILALTASPLAAGSYTLRLTLDRDRWTISTGSDPQQHYHDQADIPAVVNPTAAPNALPALRTCPAGVACAVIIDASRRKSRTRST
jgi:hypothetical protein